jgi:uncharacterized protein (DUF849 family)
MANVVPFQASQPKKLSRPEFRAEVIKLVEAGAFKVHVHLKRDHPERAISHAQIEKCLLKGTIQTDPFLNQFGNWQAEIFRHMAGHELTLVAVIEWEKQVIVITAY